MYQVVIFDMDGTILDTLEDLKDSLNYLLRANNYPERTLEEVRNFVGNGVRKLIERGVGRQLEEQELDRLFEQHKAYYKVHCADKTKPYDGVIELIQELRKAGCKTAVVSNKADYAVQELCEKYFDGLFDVAVGSRTNVRNKPAPDSVFEVLKKLGLSKEQAVCIGDSDVDIETAANAEIDSILVEWGFRSREFLLERGAETIVSRPEEILRLVL